MKKLGLTIKTTGNEFTKNEIIEMSKTIKNYNPLLIYPILIIL